MVKQSLIDTFRLTLAFMKSCWPLSLVLAALYSWIEYLVAGDSLGGTLFGFLLIVPAALLNYLWAPRYWAGDSRAGTIAPDLRTMARFAPVAILPVSLLAIMSVFGISLALIEDFGAVAIITTLAASAAFIAYLVAQLGLAPWIVERANGGQITMRQSFARMKGHKADLFALTVCIGVAIKLVSAAKFVLPELAGIIVSGTSSAIGGIMCAAAFYTFAGLSQSDMPIDSGITGSNSNCA